MFLPKAYSQCLTQYSLFLTPNSTRHNGATLDFTAMDRFISDISDGVRADGSIIARVFPPEQDVLLAFAGRIANEVVRRDERKVVLCGFYCLRL